MPSVHKFHTDDTSLPRSGYCFFNSNILVKNVLQPIKITIDIWVVMRHWYGIFVLVLQTLFCGETSIGVAKCQLIQCFHWLCYGEI